MRVVIQNANIVLPHKDTILNNSSMVIENGIISKIIKGVSFSYDSKANLIIDAENGYLIPGIIDHHVHAISLGPLFGSAFPAPPLELVLSNLNKHLLQGTTTILNQDGFATIEETEIMNKLHPIKIKSSTSHTPTNIQAAEMTDGSELNTFHKSLTAEDMLRRGAVAIGEIADGNTTGGTGVCYNLLPKKIEEKTGKRISPSEAEELLWAVLGRYIDTSVTDLEKVGNILEKIGLKGLISINEAVDIIIQGVYSPVETARKGIREAAELALRYNVPMEVHTAAGCKEVVLEIAEKLGSKLITAHSSHPSFTTAEVVENIKKLKSFGVVIDICCGDYFVAKKLCPPEYLDVNLHLIEEGLVDLISTDFLAGNWDPILLIIKKAVEEEKISLPAILAMVSCNVVKAIPKLAPNSGFIEEGKAADLVVLNSDDLAEVRHVFIDGLPVVIDGEIKVPKANWLWVK